MNYRLVGLFVVALACFGSSFAAMEENRTGVPVGSNGLVDATGEELSVLDQDDATAGSVGSIATDDDVPDLVLDEAPVPWPVSILEALPSLTRFRVPISNSPPTIIDALAGFDKQLLRQQCGIKTTRTRGGRPPVLSHKFGCKEPGAGLRKYDDYDPATGAAILAVDAAPTKEDYGRTVVRIRGGGPDDNDDDTGATELAAAAAAIEELDDDAPVEPPRKKGFSDRSTWKQPKKIAQGDKTKRKSKGVRKSKKVQGDDTMEINDDAPVETVQADEEPTEPDEPPAKKRRTRKNTTTRERTTRANSTTRKNTTTRERTTRANSTTRENPTTHTQVPVVDPLQLPPLTLPATTVEGLVIVDDGPPVEPISVAATVTGAATGAEASTNEAFEDDFVELEDSEVRLESPFDESRDSPVQFQATLGTTAHQRPIPTRANTDSVPSSDDEDSVTGATVPNPIRPTRAQVHSSDDEDSVTEAVVERGTPNQPDTASMLSNEDQDSDSESETPKATKESWFNPHVGIEALKNVKPGLIAANVLAFIKNRVTDPERVNQTWNHLTRLIRLEDRATTVTPEPTPATANDVDVGLPEGINGDAFRIHKLHGHLISNDNARTYKSRAVAKAAKGLGAGIDKSLTLDQQALALTEAVKKNYPQIATQMGLLGATAAEKKKASTALTIVNSISSLLNTKGCMGASTNDALRFQSNVFLAVAPPAPEDGATMEEKQSYNLLLKDIYRILGIKTVTVKKRFENSAINRRNILEAIQSGNRATFLQDFKRASRRIWNNELLKDLHAYLIHKCSKVVASPTTRDTKMIPDPNNPTQMIRSQKYYYTYSLEDLLKQVKKSVRLGGWAGARQKGKFISKSFLAKHLPKNLSRMTECQKQLCGCSVCLDAKGFMVALNSWRRMFSKFLVTKWKKAMAADPPMPVDQVEKLEAEATSYKEKVFITAPGDEKGKPIWESLDDPMKLLTCPGPNEGIFEGSELCHLACALQRCPNCPKSLEVFPFEDVQWEDRGICDQNFCNYMYYDGRYECMQHGIIPKGTTHCQPCIDYPEEKPDKKPKRKIHHCRGRSPIGNFIHGDFVDLIRKYRYHLLKVILLGKHWCLKFRLETFYLLEGSVLIVRDYADKLNVEKQNMSQSFAMSNRESIGFEGITAILRVGGIEDGVNEMEFFSYLSSWKVQNAKTSFVNTCLMITNLQGRGYLKRLSKATLYEQSDNCAAQYTSGTAIYCAIIIAKTFGISINKMTTAEQHGKGTVDAISGGDKAYCRKHFLTSDLEDQEIDNATVDEDGNKIDIARQLADLLGSLDRFDNQKKRKIIKRWYDSIDWTEVQCPLPETTFRIKKGTFPTVKGQKNNGSRDYYHTYTCWRIPGTTQCVMRRFPCACYACHAQLNVDWDPAIKNEDWFSQPKFKNPVGCVLHPIFKSGNEWVCVTVEPVPGTVAVEEEIEAVYNDVLRRYETLALDKIKVGGFGVYETEKCANEAPEGYYLVQWTELPFQLTEPMSNVEGCELVMPAGTFVCKGVYLDALYRANHWFVKNSTAEEKVFRLQFVVSPDIEVTPFGPGNNPHRSSQGWTNLPENIRRSAATMLVKVREDMQTAIADEMKIRADLDHFEFTFEGATDGAAEVVEEGESEEEESNGSDDSDESDEEDQDTDSE